MKSIIYPLRKGEQYVGEPSQPGGNIWITC